MVRGKVDPDGKEAIQEIMGPTCRVIVGIFDFGQWKGKFPDLGRRAGTGNNASPVIVFDNALADGGDDG
jgi:hypothetical protein